MSHLLEEYLNRKWFTTVYERSLTRWQRKIYKFNRSGPVEPVHRSPKKVKPENHEKFRMGKITTNPKSIESRERKAENAAAKKAAIQKAKEDASWEDNDKQLARKADRANAAVSFFLILYESYTEFRGAIYSHCYSIQIAYLVQYRQVMLNLKRKFRSRICCDL